MIEQKRAPREIYFLTDFIRTLLCAALDSGIKRCYQSQTWGSQGATVCEHCKHCSLLSKLPNLPCTNLTHLLPWVDSIAKVCLLLSSRWCRQCLLPKSLSKPKIRLLYKRAICKRRQLHNNQSSIKNWHNELDTAHLINQKVRWFQKKKNYWWHRSWKEIRTVTNQPHDRITTTESMSTTLYVNKKNL